MIFFENEFSLSTLPSTEEDDNEFIITAPVLTTPIEEFELHQLNGNDVYTT